MTLDAFSAITETPPPAWEQLDWTSPPPPDSFLFSTEPWREIMPEGVVMLVGEDGHGKSHIAQHLTVAICTGTDLLHIGPPEQPGKVLFLSERPNKDWWRFHQIHQAAGLDWPPQNLTVLTGNRPPHPTEQTSPQDQDWRRADLAEPLDLTTLTDHITHHYETRLPLLVIDTWAAWTPTLSENDGEAVKPLIQALRQLTTTGQVHTVLLLHHPSKAETSEKATTLTGRGHGAIRAATDQTQNVRKSIIGDTTIFRWYPYEKTTGWGLPGHNIAYTYSPSDSLQTIDPAGLDDLRQQAKMDAADNDLQTLQDAHQTTPFSVQQAASSLGIGPSRATRLIKAWVTSGKLIQTRLAAGRKPALYLLPESAENSLGATHSHLSTT